MHSRAVLLGLLALLNQADNPQQDHGAEQTGEEAEELSATGDINAEQGEQPTAQETTDDTNDDIQDDAHLFIGVHDLRADPAGKTTDDNPADEAHRGLKEAARRISFMIDIPFPKSF